MTLEEAQTLIGKRVLIKNAIDGSDIGGVLNFVGRNEYLNIPFQVTVDRMPITLESLDQITEQRDRRIFKKKK